MRLTPFKHSALGLLLAGALPIVSAEASDVSSQETVALVLESHEQRPWTLPPTLERIAIADPSIVDMTRMQSGRQALLVAKSPGSTTLLMWHKGQSAPQRIRVDVRTPVQRALLSGTDAGLTTDGGKAVAQGTGITALDHQKAVDAALVSGIGESSIAHASSLGHSGVVQVEVKVVEFSRSVMRQIGLNFSNTNGSFSYAIGSPGSSSGDSALSSAFNLIARSVKHNWAANVDLLQANGMARVLAEPTLVALSGQSASFLAGGELPILEPQGLGSTSISFKPFGIGLTVTPTVLSPQRIALKVAPEASDLDYSRGITMEGVQVPAITTRRADTTVELGDGETFIIGGLVSSQTSSMVSKIPLLGDLPVIGSFFRNLNQKQEDKELVIVVTPRLVNPIARDTALVLPGDQESQPRLGAWSSWILQPASPDPLPGFSR